MQIWIVGIIERDSNRIVLYPVHHRDEDTLIRKCFEDTQAGTKWWTIGIEHL